MTEQKELARLLAAQKAIIDHLKDADAETRDQARAAFDSGDAASAKIGETMIGRVRRDQPSGQYKITDWGKFEAWVQETAPHAWISIPQVDPHFRASVLKTGVYIDPDGVVHEVAGVNWVQSREGNLVVTTTDDGKEWARQMIGSQLRELE